jgi:hypothetical protein
MVAVLERRLEVERNHNSGQGGGEVGRIKDSDFEGDGNLRGGATTQCFSSAPFWLRWFSPRIRKRRPKRYGRQRENVLLFD